MNVIVLIIINNINNFSKFFLYLPWVLTSKIHHKRITNTSFVILLVHAVFIFCIFLLIYIFLFILTLIYLFIMSI